MSNVLCTFRGIDEIDSAIDRLDDTKVQLLFSKFPVGTGTFKRNKFIYVEFIGPKCGIVKRGKAINVIGSFIPKHLHGVPGFSTTDKASLSFESLVDQMKHVFVTDNGTFSMEQIRSEYKNRLLEEKKMMHRESRQAAAVAATKAAVAANKKPQVTKVSRASVADSKEASKPTNGALPKTEEEWSERAKRVMDSLRADNGPINWAVFDSDTKTARVLSYGTNGIFEMVKNLPDDKWLFGLFRISFVISGERQRRIIFFQWIGSQLKPVRTATNAGIYPGMVKLLSPFAYEIYLVGNNDLNPQQIINKSKCAFKPKATGASNGKSISMPTIDFSEAAYKATLEQEQAELREMPVEHNEAHKLHREKMTSVVLDGGMEQSLTSMSVAGMTQAGNYDIDETIRLVQSKEGGLVWAIFQVAD